VGMVLALITLPGTWLILLGAIVLNYGLPKLMVLAGKTMPQLFEDKTLIALVVVALLAEIIEFAASAAGAKKAGGGKSGAIFSIIGGLVGGIVGGIVIPIVGAIPGGIVGAGVGAVLGERHLGKKSWEAAARVGQGAAAGRAVATIAKSAAAAIIGGTLLVAVWL
jgi:uncharacterized protein